MPRLRRCNLAIPTRAIFAAHLKLALALVKRKGIPGDTTINDLRLGVRRRTNAEGYVKQHVVSEPAQIFESKPSGNPRSCGGRKERCK